MSQVQGSCGDAHSYNHTAVPFIKNILMILAGGAAVKGRAQAARGHNFYGLQQGVRAGSMHYSAAGWTHVTLAWHTAHNAVPEPPMYLCFAQAGHGPAVHWGGSRSRIHLPQNLQRLAPHRPHVCDTLVPQQEPVVSHIRWVLRPCTGQKRMAMWKGFEVQ